MLEDEKKIIKEKKEVAKTKKYVALKTTYVICNERVKLIRGEEIPPIIGKDFITSLINSKLIKIK